MNTLLRMHRLLSATLLVSALFLNPVIPTCPACASAPVSVLSDSSSATTHSVAYQTCAVTPQDDPVSFRRRAVDCVILQDGQRLYGANAGGAPGRLVVRTDWLKTAAPEFWSRDVQPRLQQPAGDQLQQAVTALKAEAARLEALPERDIPRIGMIGEVCQRLDSPVGTEPALILLELKAPLLRRHVTQDPGVQVLGRLAILNEIPDIETISAESAAAAINAIPEGQRRSVPENGTALSAESFVEAILAAIDIRQNKTGRFSGVGSRFVDEAASAELGQLTAGLLQDNLQSQLNELLHGDFANPASRAGTSQNRGSAGSLPDSLPDDVRRVAEEKHWQTILLTATGTDIAAGQATVSRAVFHRNHSGQWILLTRKSVTRSSRDLDPADVDAVRNDPQIRQISELFSGLGADASQLTTAFQLGTVVRNALQGVESEMNDDVSRLLNSPADALSGRGGIPQVSLP